MSASKADNYGELMSFLMQLRGQFESDEQFNQFALAEIRQFIIDLRLLGIELTMRPNYGGQPLSNLSASKKLK